MKSLDEIRDELTETLYKDHSKYDVTSQHCRRAYRLGFTAGVSAAQDRAQVLVDAITDCLISEWLDKPESLKEALESYKKSMETK